MPRPRLPRPALIAAPLALALLTGCPGNPNEPGNVRATPIGGGALRSDSGPIMNESANPAGAPPGSGTPIDNGSGMGDGSSTSVANPADTARGVSPPG
jgi:hypothetical protein